MATKAEALAEILKVSALTDQVAAKVADFQQRATAFRALVDEYQSDCAKILELQGHHTSELTRVAALVRALPIGDDDEIEEGMGP